MVPGRVFPYSGAEVHKLAETAAVTLGRQQPTLLPYSCMLINDRQEIRHDVFLYSVSSIFQRKATGADLLDKVCAVLDVMEKDYFGLLHVQRGDPRVWVDLGRRLSKTFRSE